MRLNPEGGPTREGRAGGGGRPPRRIEYDEDERREFLNGFHRRKQERRKRAAQASAERERAVVRAERAVRREALRRARGVRSAADEDFDTVRTKHQLGPEDGSAEARHVRAKFAPLLFAGGCVSLAECRALLLGGVGGPEVVAPAAQSAQFEGRHTTSVVTVDYNVNTT
jgi:hypothetical protein